MMDDYSLLCARCLCWRLRTSYSIHDKASGRHIQLPAARFLREQIFLIQYVLYTGSL